ncbi:MAG: M48 family peptidase [Deltaproteobacteria bacterium]|nr:M48 family peptidase [Deltaproteobacteria bacterium]
MKITEKAQESLQRILKSFEEGTVPEALAHTVIPTLDVPCNKWSLNNRLLTFLAGTSDARGIRQWNEVGRRIIAGKKAFYILGPIILKAKAGVEGKEGSEDEEGKLLRGFKAIPVFRLEDTEGTPLEYPPVEPPQPPPLAEVAEAWGIHVAYQAIESSRLGYYSPGKKQIVLCTHDEEVFFHELAHVAHEKVNGTLRPGQTWQQEIVAELTATTLMHLYGRAPNDGGAYRYIAGYAEKAGKDVYRACLSVIAEVEQCLDQILFTVQPLTPAMVEADEEAEGVWV